MNLKKHEQIRLKNIVNNSTAGKSLNAFNALRTLKLLVNTYCVC